MTKTVVFDMDGVLFDTEKLYIECWEEIADEAKLENIGMVLRKCTGTNEQKTREIIQAHYGDGFDLDGYRIKVKEIFKSCIREHGMPMKKGVHELLSYLKENDYTVGLASSTKVEEVKEELKSAGIDTYFDVIIGGDMVQESKPHPEIYLLACNKLGVEPKEAIAIEDSLNGIQSAYRAGMKPIMVPDLVAPTVQIEKMLFGEMESLLEVRDFLIQQNKE